MTTVAFQTGIAILDRSRFDVATLRVLYAMVGLVWLVLLPVELTLALI